MDQHKKNQRLIIIIFGMTIIPFLIALGLNANLTWLKSHVNKGQLIEPIITTTHDDWLGFDDFSQQNLKELQGHWLIVNLIPSQHCQALCLEALLKTKQLRLMLGKDLSRTRRVVMVFNDIPAETTRQWWLKDSLLWRLQLTQNQTDETLYRTLQQEDSLLDEALINRLLANENPALALRSDLIRVKPNAKLIEKLTQLRQGAIPEGMLLLIDPLGNIMMQYESGFNPYDVKTDLLHLLRISQIG